jgi:hypothetical protein
MTNANKMPEQIQGTPDQFDFTSPLSFPTATNPIMLKDTISMK